MTATTDVHEYGKRLLEKILTFIGLVGINGVVSTDPKALAEIAVRSDAIFFKYI